MPERLRSLAARLKEYVGNRRHARRFTMRLKCKISLLEINHGKVITLKTSPVAGVTRDVSSDGLGLIVPHIRVDEHYLMADHRMLRVTLKCPDGDVTIDCAPVRYEQLEQSDADHGYLLGMEIKEIPDEHRERWDEFLKNANGRPKNGSK